MPKQTIRITFRHFLLLVAVLAVLGILAYQLPPVKSRLSWRIELASAYWRGVIYPAGPVPTPIAQAAPTSEAEPSPTATPTATATQPPPTPTVPGPTPTNTPTPTPIPESVQLPAPEWEKQDWNNCGPTTLALYLRFYGWDGDQFTISDVVKPLREDRNVNVEELAYYVRNYAGWLNIEYRVGGDLQTIKKMLASGIPVMIEESFKLEEAFWPNDDLWAAHYILLTGYDDANQTFTSQDSYYGANQTIEYDALDREWKIFNRVYILVYYPNQEETVKSLLGADWDVDVNRQHALEIAQAETEADPTDAFAWFNVGTNQVYFGNYSDAATAYDNARNLKLPQRMLRYQFGPFFAYFHSGRTEDLLALTEYALERTPNSEEAMLWHGWAMYRKGEVNKAISDFRDALKANPNYEDAKYALDFIGANP